MAIWSNMILIVPSLLLHWFRCKNLIFSASQVEQIAEIIILLHLDRCLLGVSPLLQECVVSIIGSFKEEEWVSSCKKIANSLASRSDHLFSCSILGRLLYLFIDLGSSGLMYLQGTSRYELFEDSGICIRCWCSKQASEKFHFKANACCFTWS